MTHVWLYPGMYISFEKAQFKIHTTDHTFEKKTVQFWQSMNTDELLWSWRINKKVLNIWQLFFYEQTR